MDEYNDAIQRLEIQERIPSAPIHKLYFPTPRKNTPINYNYIFNTTGNGNIPKYTIPQNLIINNAANDVPYLSFRLDEQFVHTQGYRKSIAIRSIYIIPTDTSQKNNFVCSTINPWSAKNIIGRLTELFHNIPRMFQWDGSPEIKIWFLKNPTGERINVPVATGIIELELIIDNENTYALDE